jgi:L-lactate dehydrogenase complex protein LldG
MDDSSINTGEKNSREMVLANIRNALVESSEVMAEEESDEIVFNTAKEDEAIVFATQLSNDGGKFIYCTDEDEFIKLFYKLVQSQSDYVPVVYDEKLIQLLADGRIPYSKQLQSSSGLVLTECESLIMQSGSVVFSSNSWHVTNAKIHAVFAYASQLLPDLETAMNNISEKYNEELPAIISVVKGGRKADIDGRSVMPVIYVFFIDK